MQAHRPIMAIGILALLVLGAIAIYVAGFACGAGNVAGDDTAAKSCHLKRSRLLDVPNNHASQRDGSAQACPY
jgi:hypothetical protein